MRLTSSLVLMALAFRDVTCAAADRLVPTMPVDNVFKDATEGRRLARLSGFIDDFLDIDGVKYLFSEKDGQCEFTGMLKSEALLQYPGFNAVVYSNLEASEGELVNKTFAPVDVKYAVWPQQMYRLCVFETGRFTRVGDSGCEDWRCGGCVMGTDGSTVEFCRVEPTTTTTPERTTTSKSASKPTRTTIQYGTGGGKSMSGTSKGPSKTSNKAPTKTSTITTSSSRSRGTTTTQQPTTSSQPVPGTAATDTSTTPPPHSAAHVSGWERKCGREYHRRATRCRLDEWTRHGRSACGRGHGVYGDGLSVRCLMVEG